MRTSLVNSLHEGSVKEVARGRISLGIGGASWKRDRAEVLKGYTELENVFNYAMPAAVKATGAGQRDIGQASDYWSRILSGNRTAAVQAVAPEANAVRAGSDAAKRQLATSGTARGGGVAATNQQRQTETQAKIDNLLFGARPAAAQAKAGIGKAELEAGLEGTQIAGKAALDLTREGISARAEDFKINQSIVGDWQQLVEDIAAVAFA